MNYQIQLHNGQVIVAEIAEFDADYFTSALNNHEVGFINFSGYILSKNIIAAVIPFVEESK